MAAADIKFAGFWIKGATFLKKLRISVKDIFSNYKKTASLRSGFFIV